MKKITLLFAFMVFFTILFNHCSTGGGDNPTPQQCIAKVSSELSAINVFDGTLNSPYYGQVISNFKFSQSLNTYENNCKPSEYGETSLKITNTINKKVSYTYTVTATIGIVSWQYQDVASIEPNSTIDVGVINSNAQRLHIGTVVIRLFNITYQ